MTKVALDIGEPYAEIHEQVTERIGEDAVAQQYEDFIHQLNQQAQQQ